MRSAYHTLMRPPSYTLRQVIRPVGPQVLLALEAVAWAPPFQPPSAFPTPEAWLADFLRTHAAALEALPRPSGFLIATPAPAAELPEGCRLCTEPLLTVAVLGRVAGNLYIPRRAIALGAWCTAGTRVCFPAEHFPQFAPQELPQ